MIVVTNNNILCRESGTDDSAEGGGLNKLQLLQHSQSLYSPSAVART
jgi:hypothetical protein